MPLLIDLLASLPEARIICGDASTPVTDIQYDTHNISHGSALVCVPPDKDAAHKYPPVTPADAVARGAAVVISEDEAALEAIRTAPRPLHSPPHANSTSNGTPVAVPTGVLVPDARRALALMACEFYGHPSRSMLLVGITGTNGKTTTAHLTAQVLRAGGLTVGIIGTLGATTDSTFAHTGHTTPRSLDTQRLLAGFLAQGVNAVIMEVSSHGLALQRVVGCAFDVGVFTNFTQDHLNFHGSMEGYWAAKLLLFTQVAQDSAKIKPFTAAVNIDDAYGRRLLEEAVKPRGYRCVTYGIERDAEVRAEDIQLARASVRFGVRATPAQSQAKTGEKEEACMVDAALTGRFNVYNVLAAASVGRLRGVSLATTQDALRGVVPPPGRMEFVSVAGRTAGPGAVVVDYAHSPAALETSLLTLREFVGAGKRLICVFGCGGDRDASKRPLMGAAAAALAEVVVITSDNPRTEDPARIVEDIKAGLSPGGAVEVKVEIDRRKAIEYAVGVAQEGDTVLIAGKGHETYQLLKEGSVHFDDREVAREALQRRA